MILHVLSLQGDNSQSEKILVQVFCEVITFLPPLPSPSRPLHPQLLSFLSSSPLVRYGLCEHAATESNMHWEKKKQDMCEEE